MKVLFLVITFLVALHSAAQDTTATFTNTKCLYKTDGSSRSSGIKLQVEHPCEWLPYNNNSIVQGFHFHTSQNVQYHQYLEIKKLPRRYQSKTDTIFTEGGLKVLASELGYFLVSGKPIKIDTLKAAELVYKTTSKKEGKMYFLYNAQYFFKQGKYMVLLTFSVQAPKEEEAAAMFAEHGSFFQELGTSMKLLTN
jgi:hypothetical protein